jgi:hypothetical protein
LGIATENCRSQSGFAHSKTEHEESVSTGESEQRLPLKSAQYIMYDMPDDEIIGFWGKRPFIGKGIPKESEACKPAEVPVLPSLSKKIADTEPPKIAPLASWHMDPDLSRYYQAHQGTSEVNYQA